MHEHVNTINNRVHPWKIFKAEPVPENSEEFMENVKQQLVKKLNYIESLHNSQGKTFLVSDEVRLHKLQIYSLT